MDNKQIIDQLFDKFAGYSQIHESVVYIESRDNHFAYKRNSGDVTIDSPFAIASITKLYTTCCILQLIEEGKLKLTDKMIQYIPLEQIEGLHVYNGEDYTASLEIYDLLFQTSGLPDIFEEGKGSLKQRLVTEDFTITMNERISETKKLVSHFKPHSSKHAYYADINFNLLGVIIETITQQSLNQVYQERIFDPLSLQATYLISPETTHIPPVYYKDTQLVRPRFLTDDASGGVISTSNELMRFLKAFFLGELFDSAVFSQLAVYRPLQMGMKPIQYGGGFMHVPLGKGTTLFRGQGGLNGHSGTSGSFAFYYPQKELFMVGNFNQMARPDLPIRFIMNLALKY